MTAISDYEAMTPEEKAAHDAKVAAAIKEFWANAGGEARRNGTPIPDKTSSPLPPPTCSPSSL